MFTDSKHYSSILLFNYLGCETNKTESYVVQLLIFVLFCKILSQYQTRNLFNENVNKIKIVTNILSSNFFKFINSLIIMKYATIFSKNILY